MDISALQRASTRATATQAQRPGGQFAARLDAAGRPAAGSDLVGAKLTPPPGGCACDTLAATQNPTAPARPLGSIESAPGRPVALNPSAVQPGDLLLLDAVAGQADRMHLAIARSSTEMLTTDLGGTVQSMTIPWNQVRGIRRLG